MVTCIVVGNRKQTAVSHGNACCEDHPPSLRVAAVTQGCHLPSSAPVASLHPNTQQSSRSRLLVTHSSHKQPVTYSKRDIS